MKRIFICLSLCLLNLSAIAAVSTTKLQRPSDLALDIASSNEWFLKNGILNIPAEELDFEKGSKYFRLKYSLDGKFIKKKQLHFGDNNEQLNSSVLYDLLDKKTLCSFEDFKKANKDFCKNISIKDESFLIVKSQVEYHANDDALTLSFINLQKDFIELQNKYQNWEVFTGNDSSVVLFAEAKDSETGDFEFFYMDDKAITKLEIPYSVNLIFAKNCLNLKHNVYEMSSLFEAAAFNLEDDLYGLCSQGLAKTIKDGYIFFHAKTKLIRYDLKEKEAKEYDLSKFFQAKGDGFINSFKDFGKGISVISVIYRSEKEGPKEENFLVKEAKVPSFVEFGLRPVHFFDKENYLACSYEEGDELEKLLLVDTKNKTKKRVFNTETVFYGASLPEGMSNKVDDSSYGCSYKAAVIPGSGGQVFLADQYYTQKPKYKFKDGVNFHLTQLKTVDFHKIDYSRFCGLEPYNDEPLWFPQMLEKANYDKFCNEKDGLLLKPGKPVYDKPKGLFVTE